MYFGVVSTIIFITDDTVHCEVLSRCLHQIEVHFGDEKLYIDSAFPPAPAPPPVPPVLVRRGQGRRAGGRHRYVGGCHRRRPRWDTGVDSRGCVAYPAACNPCSYECVECLWNEDGETVHYAYSSGAARGRYLRGRRKWFCVGAQDLEGV